MSLQTLMAYCQAQIDKHDPNSYPAFPWVRLNVPGTANGRRKKFVNAKGAPYGEIVCELPQRMVMAIFNAREVLAFLQAAQDATPVPPAAGASAEAGV